MKNDENNENNLIKIRVIKKKLFEIKTNLKKIIKKNSRSIPSSFYKILKQRLGKRI